jgi:hypothetical protein
MLLSQLDYKTTPWTLTKGNQSFSSQMAIMLHLVASNTEYYLSAGVYYYESQPLEVFYHIQFDQFYEFRTTVDDRFRLRHGMFMKSRICHVSPRWNYLGRKYEEQDLSAVRGVFLSRTLLSCLHWLQRIANK